MTIRHDTSVHPKTVTEFSEGAARPPQRPRSSPRVLAATERRETAPEALMAAVKAAQRPGERIVVVSATEVHLVPSSRA